MKKLIDFFKREKMFTISLAAALLSLFIAPMTFERVKNLSWNTLLTLFMLFAALEGFKKEHIFDPLKRVLSNIRSTFILALSLTLIVFILSAFITNDVALLTFVPLTIFLFSKSEKTEFLSSLIIIETIAANLGSLITPFGNPQNLYIYDKMSIKSSEFVLMMLPIYIASLILIILALLFIFRKNIRNTIYIKAEVESFGGNKSFRVLYVCLFVMTLSAVLGYFNTLPLFLLMLTILIVFDRDTLKAIDWPLLATFLCFFVFSGSIASNEAIAAKLSSIAKGHEFVLSLILSQVISNVPSAILLEPFSLDLKSLLYGVDVGGLGTPVASLASLISIRLYLKEYKEGKKFVSMFLIWNVVFLVILITFSILLLA